MFLWRGSFLLVLRLKLTLVFKIRLYVLCQILHHVGRLISCLLKNSESRGISLENLDFLEEELHYRCLGDSAGWFEFGPNYIIKHEVPSDFGSFLLHTLQLGKIQIIWFDFHLSMKTSQMCKANTNAIHISLNEIIYRFAWYEHKVKSILSVLDFSNALLSIFNVNNW